MSKSDGGLRTLFRQKFPDFFFQSIEVGTVGRGVPDSHFLAPGGTAGWIEYKATLTTKVPLRPEQVAWIDRYGRLGGRAFVAVRRAHPGGPRRGDPLDELYVFAAKDVVQLAREGVLLTPCVARCEGNVRRWDWDKVRAALLTQTSPSNV